MFDFLVDIVPREENPNPAEEVYHTSSLLCLYMYVMVMMMVREAPNIYYVHFSVRLQVVVVRLMDSCDDLWTIHLVRMVLVHIHHRYHSLQSL